MPTLLFPNSCPSKSYIFKFKSNSAEAKNKRRIIPAEMLPEVKGTEKMGPNEVRRLDCWLSTGWDHQALQPRTGVIIQVKGRISEGDSGIIQAALPTTAPRLSLPFKGWSHHSSSNLPCCHHPEPRGLASRATAPADPRAGHWAKKYRLLS